MTLPDPQTVTINAVAISLPRVSSGVNTGTYRDNAGVVTETVSHTYGARNRRLFKLDHSKIAADPLTAANTLYSMGVHIVVDVPKVGYTVVEQKQVIDGFIAQLSASSGALITKILGGEN